MADTLVREAIAYGSQPLSPVPQYWDGSSYAKAQGINGAIRIINYNSAGETFTGASPASVKLTATSTVIISGTSTIAVSGTTTVNFSGSGTVEIVTSSGGTALFSNTNLGLNRGMAKISAETIYTATITWTAGTTATSNQTLTINVLTALTTATSHEVVMTNDGPYTLSIAGYKQISANGSSFNVPFLGTLAASPETISAGITYGGVRTSFTGAFNFNKGFILNVTTTAAFTSTVTNNIFIKELT